MSTAATTSRHRVVRAAPSTRHRSLRSALVALPAAGALLTGGALLAPAAQAAPGIASSTAAVVTAASATAATGSPALRAGSRGAAVRAWQQELNTFRSVDREPGVPGVARGEHLAMPAIAVDGSFGPATAAATRDFQHYAGIAADARVGPATRGAYRRTVGSGNAVGAGPGAGSGAGITGVLRRGARGEQVRTWQGDVNRFLAYTRSRGAQGRLGAAPDIAVDGRFGPRTTAATKDLQGFLGLTPDGVVGPRTRSAYGELDLG